jgi:monoamine oxidase
LGGGNQPAAGRRVVVIGAGLAGLAAARELRRGGCHVVILEARHRIGGRIWTSNQWPDMPLDMGATWIHGVEGNPITGLAEAIKARRLVTRYDRSITYATGGQALNDAEEGELERITKRIFGRLRKAQGKDPDRSIRAAVAPLLNEFDASPEKVRLMRYILNSAIEQEYAGSLDRLSTHWYDSTEEFDGDDALFAQGFQVITNYLAEGIRMELAQEAKEIHWDVSEARVVTQSSEYSADHVVVTLPLGVLQSGRVRFVPELPAKKRQAIAALGMGVLNKCYLRFEEAFWPDDVDWLGYISARPGEWTEWVSFQRAAGMPVLLGFNAGDRGREIEAWSDERTVDDAMETLKTIFGQNIPRPIDHQITRWASDPFALGSYSYHALGSTPTMRNALASPLRQRLYFAGEATHKEYYGTAHGAYLSGVRAARDILGI